MSSYDVSYYIVVLVLNTSLVKVFTFYKYIFS